MSHRAYFHVGKRDVSRNGSPEVPAGQGFTLVELLVVIGIIAVLVGVLLPALSGARKASMQVKCAAALKQIGIGVVLYSQENNGYLPPWRVGNQGMSVGGSGGLYNLYGINYGAASIIDGVSTNEAAYWMDFLSKFLTSGHGGSGDTNKQQQFISATSVIWGCPAWEGYKETRTGVVGAGGVNLQRCGYSYNYMPKMDIGYPATSVASFPNTPEKCDIRSTDNFKTWVGTDANTKPVWYKLVQVTRQAERALSGDANDFELEARAWDGTGTVPQQKLFYFDVIYARKDGGSGAIVPATSFDYYRHGSYPPVENTGAHGFFASNGGKIKYNILYFDGHVAQSNDRTDAYKSLRIQFPSPITK